MCYWLCYLCVCASATNPLTIKPFITIIIPTLHQVSTSGGDSLTADHVISCLPSSGEATDRASFHVLACIGSVCMWTLHPAMWSVCMWTLHWFHLFNFFQGWLSCFLHVWTHCVTPYLPSLLCQWPWLTWSSVGGISCLLSLNMYVQYMYNNNIIMYNMCVCVY